MSFDFMERISFPTRPTFLRRPSSEYVLAGVKVEAEDNDEDDEDF
jgi:hypothetical protein